MEIRKGPSLGDLTPEEERLYRQTPDMSTFYDCAKDRRTIIFSNSREETGILCDNAADSRAPR